MFLLEGFGFQWLITPHRINKVGLSLVNSGILLAQPEIRFQGGTFSTGEEGVDLPTVTVRYGAFRASRSSSVLGRSPTLRGYGACSRTERIEPAEAAVRVSVDLPGFDPSRCRGVVLLNGFSLATDVTHPEGFTVGSVGARIRDVAWSVGRVAFTLWMQVGAAPVWDREQHLDRYGFEGDVTYHVLWADGAYPAHGSVAYRVENPAPGIYPRIPHASAAQQRLVLVGRPGLSFAVAGLTGFFLNINAEADLFPGRYLRELSVFTRDIRYDPASGEVALLSDGYFSNSGLVTWPMTADCEAGYAALLWEEPEGRYESGEASVSQLRVDPVMFLWHTFPPGTSWEPVQSGGGGGCSKRSRCKAGEIPRSEAYFPYVERRGTKPNDADGSFSTAS